MAATTIDELLVRIDATTEGLRRELKRGEAQLVQSSTRMEARVKRLNLAFSKLGRVLGPIGIGVSLAALSRGMTRAIGDLAKLADTADKLGISTQALQELRFAGEEVGVAVNTTDMAIQRFTRRVGEAAQGSGELKGTLDQYSIAVRNADGSTRSIDAVLGDVANAIQGAESDAERLRIAFKAFDSEGAAFVNVLRDGNQGLQTFRDRANELGQVMDDKLIQRAKELNREWAILMRRLGIGVQSAVLGIVDVFDGMDLGDINQEIVSLSAAIEALQQADAKAPGTESAIEAFTERINQLETAAAKLQTTTAGSPLDVNVTGPGIGDPDLRKALPAAEPGRDARARDIQATTTAINEEIAALQRVADAFELSTKAGEEWQIRENALTEARRLSTGLTDHELQQLQAQIERRERLSRVLDENRTAQASLTAANQQFATQVRTSGVEALTALASGYGDARTIAVKAIADIINAILNLIIAQEAAAASMQATSASGFLGFLSTFAGGFFGAAGGPAVPAGFSTSPGATNATGALLSGPIPRAGGGAVNPGQTFMVGERGPELFVPSSSGRVTPNAAVSSGGGQTTIIADMRGADAGAVRELRAMVSELHATFEPRAVAAVINQRSRSPRMFRAVG